MGTDPVLGQHNLDEVLNRPRQLHINGSGPLSFTAILSQNQASGYGCRFFRQSHVTNSSQITRTKQRFEITWIIEENMENRSMMRIQWQALFSSQFSIVLNTTYAKNSVRNRV